MTEGLSFVTVTWNSAPFVEALLRSMSAHLRGPYEVIVVDNASTDGTPEKVRAVPGHHRVLETGSNLGFALANNLGVGRATYDAAVLINPDCELVDDSIARLATESLRLGAICGPRVLNPDLSYQPSASPVPGSWEGMLNVFLPRRLMPRSVRRRCLPWTARGPTEVGWLTGACLAGPTTLLRELGPFHVEDHLYGEDIDLGLRVRRAGYHNLFLPDVARVVHFGDHASSQRFPDAGVRLSLETRREVVRRNLGTTREFIDFISQGATYGGRYLVRRASGGETRHELEWLRAWRSTRKPTNAS